jgi:DNA-binding NarL/FixJ family response regulator
MVKKKILLVEDDDLLRMGLRTMVEMHKNYIIMADTATGAEAIKVFTKQRPDIVLLDLRLPDIPGVEVLRVMKETAPEIPVLALTVCEDNELIFQALECGASAYVLKGSGPDELFLGIHYALKGDLFISPKIARAIVKDFVFVNRQRKLLPPLHNLTSREKEIVKLIIDGVKSKSIAERLFISVKTVDKHRSNILSKLGIHSCSELRQRKMYILDSLDPRVLL